MTFRTETAVPEAPREPGYAGAPAAPAVPGAFVGQRCAGAPADEGGRARRQHHHARRQHQHGTRNALIASGVLLAALAGCSILSSGSARPDEETEEPRGLFSHKFHLERFVDVDCTFCHTGAEPLEARMSTKEDVCYNCHDRSESVGLEADMSQFSRPRVVGAYDHREHDRLAQARGEPLACDECHAGVRQSAHSSDPNIPVMEDCWNCHQQHEGTRNLTECTVCHVDDGVDTDPAHAPESHLRLMGDVLAPTRVFDPDETPGDHNEYFRLISHGRASTNPAAKCYSCHRETSCDNCHRDQPPRDHTPRFRRSIHGRLAANDRERCATCHQTDECATCHNSEPRNHTFAFRELGAHVREARLELRACFACHNFDESCSRCHVR